MSSPPPPTNAGFMDRNYHLLRRLHSLTGIVPIGVFLINHLLTNSSILWGKYALRGEYEGLSVREGGVAYFAKEVTWINTQIPHLLLIEITLWSAIAFHSILGLYYAMTGKGNVSRYAYQSNWRYTLQRISGYIGILFIFYHVATLRWGWTFLIPPFDGSIPWSAEYSASTLASALRGGNGDITFWGFAVSAFYFLGVSLLVFHFANGLWTAAITWGLTISTKAQKRWGYVCAGLGASMMLMAWGSVIGFMTLKPGDAKPVEDRIKGVEPPVEPAGSMTAQATVQSKSVSGV